MHEDDSQHGYELSIRVTGKIAGEADISLVLNGKEYKNYKTNGLEIFAWVRDWCSDTAELRYIPKCVGSGGLLIEYKCSSM
jgi:hypothetical protein